MTFNYHTVALTRQCTGNRHNRSKWMNYRSKWMNDPVPSRAQCARLHKHHPNLPDGRKTQAGFEATGQDKRGPGRSGLRRESVQTW